MASSFEKAFTQAYQAEMARRKEAEAEIAREARAEKRFEREMEQKRAWDTERELAQEAREIERERRVSERASELLAESRQYKKREESLAEEKDINRRLADVGMPQLGAGSEFQPIENQFGIPITQEQLIALKSAEDKRNLSLASERAGALERATLGAKEAVLEEGSVARAMAEFGEDAVSKPPGFWRRHYAEEDKRKNVQYAQFLQDRESAIKVMHMVPQYVLDENKKTWFDERGALNEVGTYEMLKGFGQREVDEIGPDGLPTGRKVYQKFWVPKPPRLDAGRESGVAEQGSKLAAPIQGPTPERTGWGRTGNVGGESNFLKSTEQYVPTLPTTSSAPTQETPVEDGDRDFFSYLDKVRKSRFVQPVEAISGPIPYATKLATDALTDSELWKKYGPSDRLRGLFTPPWSRPANPATPPIKPWSQDYYTR